MTPFYILVQWLSPWVLLLPLALVLIVFHLAYVRWVDHLFSVDEVLQQPHEPMKGCAMSEDSSTHLNAGLVLSALFVVIHTLWATLVALGWGQPVLDFVFWLHMLNSPFKVQSFDVTVAVFLVLATGTIGFVVGCMASFFWRTLNPLPKRE